MLQSKTDNPLDGLHLETYVRADADGVASCAAGLLAARCAEAVSRRGVFTLALSGGSTPLTLFRLLRTEAWAARVDWAHTRVFWVDERCVAPDHPASNYGAANQELLAHVPAAEIYPMDGEIDPGESAVAYEELLRQLPFRRNRGCVLIAPCSAWGRRAYQLAVRRPAAGARGGTVRAADRFCRGRTSGPSWRAVASR
ncbi:MAG: 6-phosphogluconolactonase [Bilophila wadsworthia]